MREWFYILFTLFTATVQTTEHIDVTEYEYGIDSEGHVFEGFVYEDVLRGSFIEVSKIPGEVIKEEEKEINYLRLKLTKGNNSMTNVGYDIVGTDAFAVNEEGYIIVNETEALITEKVIQFYVVLIQIPDDKIVSNPIPFVVRLAVSTKENDNYSAAAAIFAGVLILVIVVLALFIPFVVRAKRRYRSGRPIMKSGSHVSDFENKGFENGPDNPKRVESKEPEWFKNTEYKYADEVEKEKNEFTQDIIMSSGASNVTPNSEILKQSKVHGDTVYNDSKF